MAKTGCHLVNVNSKREIMVVEEDPLEALLEDIRSTKHNDFEGV